MRVPEWHVSSSAWIADLRIRHGNRAIGVNGRTKSEHPAGRGFTRISLSSYGVVLARFIARDQRDAQAHIINDNFVINRDEVCEGGAGVREDIIAGECKGGNLHSSLKSSSLRSFERCWLECPESGAWARRTVPEWGRP
jgi:hypothetical protein